MPNNFITQILKQGGIAAFVSVLNLDLEAAMRDTDKNSH